ASGVAEREVRHLRLADMRYVGQGHEVRVPLPDGVLGPEQAPELLRAFEGVYRELYGREGPPVAVEGINWRVVSSGPKPELRLEGGEDGVRPHPTPTRIGGADPPEGEGDEAVVARIDNPSPDPKNDAGPAGAAVKGTRPAYFPERGGFVETPVLDRY